MKEITYIHAEGHLFGELKHGSLALVDKTLPVLVVAPTTDMIEKVKSNIQEVCACKGRVFILTDDVTLESNPPQNVKVIYMPLVREGLEPVLYAAAIKVTDVDKPRNLAKSVIVE